MCRLCSNDPEERKLAVQHHLYIASRLEALASDYRKMAYGEVKLHVSGDKNMEAISSRAKEIVRELVNEFI